jgi:type IV secretory pathway VirB2 component (pilin)
LTIKEWLRELRIERLERKRNKSGETTANYFEVKTGKSSTPVAKGAQPRGIRLAGMTALILLLSMPTPALASIEGMMGNLQSAILTILAPMVCVGGIIFAGFKLAMGDESAKRMLLWSCIGTVIAFTAPSILSFLQTRVAS